ncbi:MAG: argininosuccinate lyase [Candidatus Caenarcaniphilales bacterium]|nr:argininosuccinate lyase [Candidatus Caenarcaniphilales bacterium]
MNKQKLWAGRSTTPTNELLDEFNSSFPFDFVLWKYDLRGSKAHVQMLSDTKIISYSDAEKILNGLNQVEKEIEKNEKLWFEKNKNEEDVHMAIERRLTELIGDTAKKLHTARSRNDQVATDLRLWLINENLQTCDQIIDLRKVLLNLAERDSNQILPGYTHLQKAQPISLGHYWMAHYERLSRDFERFNEIRKRVNNNPLGSGALAGTTYPIDRDKTTSTLGFSSPTKNSLDAVSDRDFVAEHHFASTLLIVHLSQLAEELIIWSTDEFNFIKLDDQFATGSSMMPQKKNPDVPELIRGKSGRVLGNLQSILVVLKGLPLAYNKDLQEDKEALFDTCKTIKLTLEITSRFLESIKINNLRMDESVESGFLNATDAADYLVKKNIPFREAYYAVGRAVQYCTENDKSLADLTINEWKKFHEKFEEDVASHISLRTCLDNRKSYGGTSPDNVKLEISKAREITERDLESIKKQR